MVAVVGGVAFIWLMASVPYALVALHEDPSAPKSASNAPTTRRLEADDAAMATAVNEARQAASAAASAAASSASAAAAAAQSAAAASSATTALSSAASAQNYASTTAFSAGAAAAAITAIVSSANNKAPALPLLRGSDSGASPTDVGAAVSAAAAQIAAAAKAAIKQIQTAGTQEPGQGVHGTKPGNHSIPKIIHQTWKTKHLPSWATTSVDTWKSKNPDYQHILYNDTEIDSLIRLHYPEILPYYHLLKPVQKADIFRYLILSVKGGLYSDVDVQCLKPIDDW
jgi:hypothetical protein